MSRHILAAVAWPYANGPRHIGHVAGFGVPSRRLQPLSPAGRQQRAHGQRHRRARHADPGPGRPGGRDAAGARRPLQPGHRRGPAAARAVLRPVHPHDDAEPLRRGPGDVQDALPQRLHGRADYPGRDLAVDRPDAARPLHRGHLPDLRLPRGARRPVRQLRQPARRRAADQPAVADQRRDADLRRDRAVLPRPAGARRRAGLVAADPHRLASERPEVLDEPASTTSSRAR